MSSHASVQPSRTKLNPGACRYGNFINYYHFHPAEERVRQLPCGVWRAARSARKYVGLDIGCNVGDLTIILRDFLETAVLEEKLEVSLLGVDLDPILIDRAREHNPRPDRVTFECLDFLSEDHNETLRKYLEVIRKPRFDVVFCFSITMWIHLNHGDEGLERFIQKACSMSDMIVIEVQPWKCYRSASRRLRRARVEGFPLLNKLKYTGDTVKHIQDILTNLCNFRRVLVTTVSKWRRELLIYERKR